MSISSWRCCIEGLSLCFNMWRRQSSGHEVHGAEWHCSTPDKAILHTDSTSSPSHASSNTRCLSLGEASTNSSATSELSASKTDMQQAPAALQTEVQRDVYAEMKAAAEEVSQWSSDSFKLLRTLQPTETNKGVIELMRDVANGGGLVAVKRMPNSWVCTGPDEFKQKFQSSPEEPWSDIGVLRYLNKKGFKYVCGYQGVFRDEKWTYFLSSFACQGDLCARVDSGPPVGEQRENMIRPIMQQVCHAVGWLHDLGITHCDISLENIVLTTTCDGLEEVKLIDFGMASPSRFSSKQGGKMSYIAPEVLSSVEHDGFASDAFAVGVVLFTLAARQYPWQSTLPSHPCRFFAFARRHGMRHFVQQVKVNRLEPRPRLTEVFSAGLVDVTVGLLSMDPEGRLTLGERCWISEGDSVASAPSVWDLAWLNQPPAAMLPDHVESQPPPSAARKRRERRARATARHDAQKSASNHADMGNDLWYASNSLKLCSRCDIGFARIRRL
eukprot:TRINITY_DN22578_c0_g1_i2.p1 TRINITY_DN22578_c0_g1~~TRINITY_DN22578_c0_g1_i2.p1  ORF type:complete len:498 (-),score=71.18 TRINITY_DN22578_c0_g1_i2:28-1521(-)